MSIDTSKDQWRRRQVVLLAWSSLACHFGIRLDGAEGRPGAGVR